MMDSVNFYFLVSIGHHNSVLPLNSIACVGYAYSSFSSLQLIQLLWKLICPSCTSTFIQVSLENAHETDWPQDAIKRTQSTKYKKCHFCISIVIGFFKK